MTINISIAIPFFNEEKNLEILIPKLIKNLKKIKKKKFEIILIDDCSTDQSLIVAKSKIRNSRFIIFKIIHLKNRSGQTGAFKSAFKIAKGKYIIRMDSDLQDNPKDIIKFVDKINLGYDLVIGKRHNRTHPLILIFYSNVYSFILRLFLNSNIRNYSSSFVAFKIRYLKNLQWNKNDHRYLPIITIMRGAKKITEIKVSHNKRKFGVSRYNLLKKVFLGIPEFILFLFRLYFGYYSKS